MQTGAIRPKFQIEVCAGTQDVLAKIRECVERPDFDCRGWVAPPYAELEVEAGTKDFWSPRLALYVEGDSKRCVVHGRFQPEPNTWTLYMAAWGILAVLGACAVAWVCAHWIMGAGQAVPLSSVSVVVVLAFGLHAAAMLGQRLGAEQMTALRRGLDAALDSAPSGPVVRVRSPQLAYDGIETTGA